jgi:Viral BACON domain
MAAAVVLAVAVGVALGWERTPAVSRPGSGAAAGTPAPTTSLPERPGSTVSTGPATSASTSATTASSAMTSLAAPASLAVSPTAVDLGATRASVVLTLRNGGGEALSWTASTAVPWLRVSPARGRLDGGRRLRVRLTADRAGLPEGTADGIVELTWDGPVRRVTVSLDVEDPPEIGGLAATPSQIGTTGCPQDTALVQATVQDESPLASVTLEWGGTQVPMAERAGTWSATLGPVDQPGTVAWRVVAADKRGNQAAAPGPPVSVVPCIPR